MTIAPEPEPVVEEVAVEETVPVEEGTTTLNCVDILVQHLPCLVCLCPIFLFHLLYIISLLRLSHFHRYIYFLDILSCIIHGLSLT